MERLEIFPAKCDGRCPVTKPHIAERKLDGHRALLHLGKDLSTAFLTSGHVSKKTGRFVENGQNVPQITSSAHNFAYKCKIGYTVLDGEVIVPGHPFEAVQSVMGSLPSVAIDWQVRHNAYATLNIFHVLFYNGVDLRDAEWLDQRIILEEIAGRLDRFGKNILLVDSVEGGCHDAFYNKVVAEGGEGVILKNPYGSYGKGWTKRKRESTFDVVITGFTSGNGKYSHLFGALQFGVYKDDSLVEVGQCSGMPDDLRAWFWENRGSLLGTVVEVKGNGLTKHGKLRHPQFTRLRSDKSARECVDLTIQESK